MRVKVRFLVVLFFCTSFSVESFAQRVYVEGVNAVMDCSSMPAGSVKSVDELNASKTDGGRVRRHAQSSMGPSQGKYIGGYYGTTTLYVNAKVSRKFVVASADAGNMNWAAAAGWAAAANVGENEDTVIANSGCATYSEIGLGSGGWRLPTQREQMIIYAHRGQLERVGGFIKFTDGHYWSATEDKDESWMMQVPVENGACYENKNILGYVRCIWDL